MIVIMKMGIKLYKQEPKDEDVILMTNSQRVMMINNWISKVYDRSRGRPEGFFFIIHYIEI